MTTPPPSPGDSAHWSRIARRWEAIGSPLRPHAEDLGFVEREASGWAGLRGMADPRACSS
ncbi:MAG: hypothetical protein ACO23N_03295 [Opitutales bacterium]